LAQSRVLQLWGIKGSGGEIAGENKNTKIPLSSTDFVVSV